MNAEQIQEQLDNINAAIANIAKAGQRVQTRNGSVQQADLSVLIAERNNLQRQLLAAQSVNQVSNDFSGNVPLVYCGRG